VTEITAAQTPARSLRDAIEPFHSICYFTDEVKARYIELGMHPWASYFGQRAAPMGAVTAPVVTATFYGFSPSLVEKSVPAVWDRISPADAWADRVRSVGIVLDRAVAGLIEPSDLDRAIATGEQLVDAFVPGGRPLGSAHAVMPRPSDPLQHLWVVVSALREYRGDGHVAALVAAGVEPIESMVTSTGFSNLSMRFHRRGRGWTEEQWNAGVERARARGWIDETGSMTAEGIAVREDVERSTDAAMDTVLAATTPEDLAALIDTVGTLSSAVIRAGDFPS